MNATPSLSPADADAAVAWYAEALAIVHHFRLQDATDIAARLHVSPAEWTAIDDAWTAALTATGVLLDPAVALGFATSFARARRRLMQTTEEPSPLRELPTYLRRPPVGRGEPAPALAVSRPAGPAVATLRMPPAGGEEDDTIVPASLGPGPDLPFAPAAKGRAGLVNRAPLAQTEEAAVPDGHGTAVLGAFVPGPAVPFMPADASDDADDGNGTMLMPAWSEAMSARVDLAVLAAVGAAGTPSASRT